MVTTTPGDAAQLPSWLSACLSRRGRAEVGVMLGSYPNAGWTDEDWTELAALVGSPGGAASIRRSIRPPGIRASWNSVS